MKTKLLSWVALALVLAEVGLFLLSWLLSAMMTEGVRSLLSNEGIRWFVGSFCEVMQSPQLIWLLLLSMSGGSLEASGLLRHRPQTYRERVALRLVLFLLILYIGVWGLLVLAPHAVLLSADGALWPSAFSHGLIPAVAFGGVLLSVAYGAMAGNFRSLPDVFASLARGISWSAPLLVLYVMFAQFYASLRFVFM